MMALWVDYQKAKSSIAIATQPFLKESFLWRIMVVLHQHVRYLVHMNWMAMMGFYFE